MATRRVKDEKEEKEGKKEEKTRRVIPKTVEVKEDDEAPKDEEQPKLDEEKGDKKEEEKKPEPEQEKEHSFSDLSGPLEEKPKFPWLVFIVFTLVFAVLGGVGGYFAYQKGVENGKKIAESSTPVTVATPTPTASSAAELKRGDLSLEVLNGTGETGLASEAKTFLEGKGYTVDNIDNAKVFGATETQISIKDSKVGYVDLLKNDLSEKYPVASDSTGLSENSAYDAVITIGH